MTTTDGNIGDPIDGFDNILDRIEAGIRAVRNPTSTAAGAGLQPVPPRSVGFGNGDLVLLVLIVGAVFLLK